MFTSRVNPVAKWLAALALLLPALGQALPEDRNQPIRIESDSARRDARDDLVIYEGSVRIDQGTLHIDADKVTVHFANGEADRIVCEGTPAVYRQQQKPDSAPVDARARQIDYLMGQDLVVSPAPRASNRKDRCSRASASPTTWPRSRSRRAATKPTAAFAW